jgi:hypothetical protein
VIGRHAVEELTGPAGEFFAGHFGRAPLYRQAGLRQPGRILSIADLDTLLHLEAIRPPYLRVMRDGTMVPHLTFTQTRRVQGADVTDVVIPELVYDLLRGGATVTWPAVNQVRPDIRELTQAVSAVFAAETSATAFLAPADSRGLYPQHTYFDMFVLQLEGLADWTVWPRKSPCRGDARHYREGELGAPDMTVRLHPGDVLYLPWGTPHVTVPAAQLSLHLSVLVRVRLWEDLLRLTVRRLLAGEPYREAPHLTPRSAAPLGARAGSLAAALRGVEAGDELRQLIRAGRESLGSAQGSAFQALTGADWDDPA